MHHIKIESIIILPNPHKNINDINFTHKRIQNPLKIHVRPPKIYNSLHDAIDFLGILLLCDNIIRHTIQIQHWLIFSHRRVFLHFWE